MVLNGPCWSEMVQGGPSFQNGERCLKHWKKIHVANERSERRRGEGRRRKNGNARPSSPFLRFNLFSVFFSLCLNLSMWPGRQVVPDESRCYIPIFDGLVRLLHCICISDSKSISWFYIVGFKLVYINGWFCTWKAVQCLVRLLHCICICISASI